MPDINRARDYATMAHGSQTYNDEMPYIRHPEMVVQVVRVRFGVNDEEMECGAWLHDVLEDCPGKKYKHLVERFGRGVAELVWAVTSERGRDRKEQNAKTYPKIIAHPRAAVLKLADRIANVEYGLAHGGGKVEMYREEFEDFYAALRIDHPEMTPEDRRVKHAMLVHLALILGKTVPR